MSVIKENSHYIDNDSRALWLRQGGAWNKIGYLKKGKQVLVGTATSVAPYIWAYDDKLEVLPDPATLPSSYITNCSISPDGLWLAVTAGGTQSEIWIYKITPNGLLFDRSLGNPYSWGMNAGTVPMFTPDGKRLVIVHGTTPWVWVVDARTWATLAGPTLPDLGSNVQAAALSDSILAVRYNVSPYLAFYDTTTWDEITLPFSVTGSFSQMTFSPDSAYFAMRSGSSNVRAFDTATWSALTISGATSGTAVTVNNDRAMAWNSDATLLAMGITTSPFLQLYSRSGTTLTKLSDPATLPIDDAKCFAFTKDDAWLIALCTNTAGAVNRLIAYKTADWSAVIPDDQFAATSPTGIASSLETFDYAPPVEPTVTDYNSGSGTHEVTAYNTLTIELWGGGAGAGSYNFAGNTIAGDTTVSTYGLTAGRGKALNDPAGVASTASGGTASGGNTTNTNGQNGGAGNNTTSGKGGDSPNGGAGGAALAVPAGSGVHLTGNNGNAPGGGGGGSAYRNGALPGSQYGGGGGAYVKHVFNAGDPGAPAIGGLVAYAVGAAGVGSSNGTVGTCGSGAPGRVRFTVT